MKRNEIQINMSTVEVEYPGGRKAVLGEIAPINEFAEAMKIIINEFKNDQEPGSIFFGWQSNLACIIKDYDPTGKLTMEDCNKMAIAFLKRLMGNA